MDADTQWRETWPPPGAAAGAPQLPRAVEFTVILEDMDRITRVLQLVEVPESLQQPQDLEP